METISKKKIATKIIIFLLIFTIIFTALSNLFERKDFHSRNVDGFYNLEENSQDIIFFGSSHMFCSIMPNLLSEEYGIESYAFGTSEQPLQATYHFMVEALKTQSPEVMVVETHMVNLSDDVLTWAGSGSRIHFSTDSMKFSWNKIEAINALSYMEESSLPFHINFYEYHSRWNSLKQNDFTYRSSEVQAEDRGYYPRAANNLVEREVFDINALEATPIDPIDREYLDKMLELADSHNIELIFLKTPWMISEEAAAVQLSVEQYANEHDISYYNGNAKFDEYNFDLAKDFYDFHHLNNTGARKFTKAFGEYLVEVSNS